MNCFYSLISSAHSHWQYTPCSPSEVVHQSCVAQVDWQLCPAEQVKSYGAGVHIGAKAHPWKTSLTASEHAGELICRAS